MTELPKVQARGLLARAPDWHGNRAPPSDHPPPPPTAGQGLVQTVSHLLGAQGRQWLINRGRPWMDAEPRQWP